MIDAIKTFVSDNAAVLGPVFIGLIIVAALFVLINDSH